jgi:hydrogenase maturation protease
MDACAQSSGKCLILGLGNPLRGDDAVGFKTAERLKGLIKDPQTVVEPLCAGGMRVLDILEGFHSVVAIDAIVGTGKPTGEVFWFEEEFTPAPGERVSSHSLHLWDAIELGSTLGMEMPEEVHLLAIAIGGHTSWSDALTTDALQGVNRAVEEVLRYLEDKARKTNHVAL